MIDDPRARLNDEWKTFREFEEDETKKVVKKFKKFFDSTPPNVKYGWLQCRMGLFTKGNNWEPISKNKKDINFRVLQDWYREVFGSEASVNFNLSRAALYCREQGVVADGGRRFCSQLLVCLALKGPPFSIKLEGQCVCVTVTQDFANHLLPGALFEAIRKNIESNIAGSEGPYTDFQISEWLQACRQKTLLKSVNKWTETGLNDGLIDQKYARDFVTLAVFLLTLEYLTDDSLRQRWQNIVDDFAIRTADDLLMSALSVIQASLYWLFFVRGETTEPTWLFNGLCPLQLDERQIKEFLKYPASGLDKFYSGVLIPPDLIALAGTGTADAKEISAMIKKQVKVMLGSGLLALDNALNHIALTADFNEKYYRYKAFADVFDSSLPEANASLKNEFALALSEDRVLTKLFPIDAHQFDLFLRFCRSSMTSIGQLEGRRLRFSLVLGTAIQLIMYFSDDPSSCEPFEKDRSYELEDPLTAERATGIIRGNAGLFQVPEYHLYCHAGKRWDGKVLELAHVVREKPFVHKAPIGNLFSAEVLQNGTVRFLRNWVEKARLKHGDLSVKPEFQEKRLRGELEGFLNWGAEAAGQNWDKELGLVLRTVQGLRDRSHGGTMIFCTQESFQEWDGSADADRKISRQTTTIKNWDELVVKEGCLAILTELVGQDGATLFVRNGKRIRALGKYVIHPVYRDSGTGLIKVFNHDDYTDKRYGGIPIAEYWAKNDWPNWQMQYNKWGTRHLSSIAFSALVFDKAFVITVSADGPVSCFYRGLYLTKLSWE